jgi:hypothetical protein
LCIIPVRALLSDFRLPPEDDFSSRGSENNILISHNAMCNNL